MDCYVFYNLSLQLLNLFKGLTLGLTFAKIFYITICGHAAFSVAYSDPSSNIYHCEKKENKRGGRPVVRQSTKTGSVGEATAASAVGLSSI